MNIVPNKSTPAAASSAKVGQVQQGLQTTVATQQAPLANGVHNSASSQPRQLSVSPPPPLQPASLPTASVPNTTLARKKKKKKGTRKANMDNSDVNPALTLQQQQQQQQHSSNTLYHPSDHDIITGVDGEFEYSDAGLDEEDVQERFARLKMQENDVHYADSYDEEDSGDGFDEDDVISEMVADVRQQKKFNTLQDGMIPPPPPLLPANGLPPVSKKASKKKKKKKSGGAQQQQEQQPPPPAQQQQQYSESLLPPLQQSQRPITPPAIPDFQARLPNNPNNYARGPPAVARSYSLPSRTVTPDLTQPQHRQPPLQQQSQSQPQQPQASQYRQPESNIWNRTSDEEMQGCKDFWFSLSEDERRSLVRIEKDGILKKIKEQQKHSCSCTVCGRKR